MHKFSCFVTLNVAQLIDICKSLSHSLDYLTDFTSIVLKIIFPIYIIGTFFIFIQGQQILKLTMFAFDGKRIDK